LRLRWREIVLGLEGFLSMMRHVDPRSVLPVLLAAIAVAVVAPAAASADEVMVTASPDPVEDVPYQVSVSGTGSTGMQVDVTMKAAGGQPCAANRAADTGSGVMSRLASGPFSYVVNRFTADSGTYLLCAWVAGESDDSPTAVAQQVFTVRPPKATASVVVPARVGGGSRFQLSVVAQTEVHRGLFVDVNGPGVPCAANFAANRTLVSVFDSRWNVGGPFTHTANVSAPRRRPGIYRVCGYVQEEGDDSVAEATFGTPFTVFSYLCRPAQKASRKYARLARQLQRKLRRADTRRAKRAYRSKLRVAKRKQRKADSDVAAYCI